MPVRSIWLADDRGRHAVVALLPRRRPEAVRHLDRSGSSVRAARCIKGTPQTAHPALAARYSGSDQLARALVASDPELDIEVVGQATGPCDRVYVDHDGKPLYAARIIEVVCDADSNEVERRPPRVVPSNLVPDAPPVWSGKYISVADAVRRFAFTRGYTVCHTDTLQYDFLYRLAAHLEERQSLVLVGSGPRGTGPLVVERNAAPMKGLLFGETRAGSYRLMLLLSSFELRVPRTA